MSGKKRLDVLLTERGLQESRQRAQAVIMSGEVFVNGQRVDKPGTAVAEDAQIEVRGGTLAYVSRGGLKLEKAMATFPIDLNGAVCADIGASTGGFTDCMLQNGAEKVYAVDVGYGQLAWKLRSDPQGGVPGADQRPVSHPRAGAGRAGLRLRGRELHLPEADPAAPERPAEGRRPRRLPGEAPVRGRPGEGGEEGRGPGPGRSTWRCWSTFWTMPGNRGLYSAWTDVFPHPGPGGEHRVPGVSGKGPLAGAHI